MVPVLNVNMFLDKNLRPRGRLSRMVPSREADVESIEGLFGVGLLPPRIVDFTRDVHEMNYYTPPNTPELPRVIYGLFKRKVCRRE